MARCRWLILAAMVTAAASAAAAAEPVHWDWCGWGGGGFFYSSAFHPTQNGTVYMGGDVTGVYKSVDHGKSWRLVNNGLVDYGVFSLACDRTAPDTVYAATAGGLCKSTDGAKTWQLLPKTGPRDLRITGEKGKSTRCIAVDPRDGKVLYAGSPAGKIYRSGDGGESWTVAWQKAADGDPADMLRVQFGKVNQDYYGGFWLPFAFPKDLAAADVTGFGLSFRGDGTIPQDCFLTLKDSAGVSYRSRNLRDVFGQTAWGEIVLSPKDFVLDPDWAKKNPDAAKAYTGPDWAKVNRLDFVCVGPLMNAAPVGKFTRFYYATAAGVKVVRAFADKSVQTYGNLRLGSAQGGPVQAIAVADTDPKLVIAATDDSGLLLSSDAGTTWRALNTPTRATTVAFAPSDARIIYGGFGADGLHKSVDGGATWQNLSASLPKGLSVNEVAISPKDANRVALIGSVGWGGAFAWSADGGKTWTQSSKMTVDHTANPTLPGDSTPTADLSAPRNLALNPQNPDELFIAANWRPAMSSDGGRTWAESARGADISCVYDVRFDGGRVYAAAMDEGTLVSEDNGGTWRALWPAKWDKEMSGHNWRLAVSGQHIVATCSPWDSVPNRVLVSQDGGKTVQRVTAGLPASNPSANTMWGTGYPRALAVDPKDPKVFYLGIDGDPADGKPGGGIFRSEDGGLTWKALPGQPGSRRMFFGLAVDPTDAKRLFWGACGNNGGVWRSEDGGATWQNVFKNDYWVFNLHVAADGTIYVPGKNLWRSTDHGATWKQLTRFPDSGRVIVGLETDPANPQRLWFSASTWDGSDDGGIYETTDGGTNWTEITGDTGYRKPLVLRYNPATKELWAAGVCLHKTKR
ncbi:MAG: hypothetical protein HZB16_24085 [Armatimonadetes bacterium]|nr:hypothetical protein [Armatimonadota bacterium]